MNITIAGASGFVGQHLIKTIDPTHSIRGLSRSKRESNQDNLNWVEADLFSLQVQLMP